MKTALLSRKAACIAAILLAPLVGGLISYFVVTRLASTDGVPQPPADRAEAGAAVPTPSGRWSVEEAQAFQEYAVFWVGEEFNGMPLRIIRRMQYFPPEEWARPDTDMVNVSYGDCTPTPCPLPITITSNPYCLVRPEMFAEGLLGPAFDLRGASAHWVGRGEDKLVLYTGGSTVTVIATAGRDAVLQAANALVAINGIGPTSPEEALGPVTVNCSRTVTQLAIGAASGLLSTLLNGTALSLVLELYRQIATSSETTESGGIRHLHPEGGALVAWQVVFYVTMVLSLCTTVLLAAFLARRFRTPAPPTIVFALFLVGLVAYPFLYFQSYANDCALGHAFPFGGTFCD